MTKVSKPEETVVLCTLGCFKGSREEETQNETVNIVRLSFDVFGLLSGSKHLFT
jgi:hypothetical protein